MKKKFMIITLAILIPAAGIVIFLWYMGSFSTINVQEKEEGGFIVAGMDVTGPYKEGGKYISKVNSKLQQVHIASHKGFGIYYDNPATTPEEKCRSFMGCVLEEKDLGRIADIEATGLKVDTIKKVKSVVAEFPLKNMFSYMIGPGRVYPAINKYMQEKNYQVTLSYEVYDDAARKITYVMQVR